MPQPVYSQHEVDAQLATIEQQLDALDTRITALEQEQPPPLPEPTPPQLVFTSIEDGDTVENGATWTVDVEPKPDSVELWADGIKLATVNEPPYETTLDLADGPHQLGVAAWQDVDRTVFGEGGVVARITVVDEATQGSLPAFRVDLPANTSGQHVACWVIAKSPSTPWHGPSSSLTVNRFMLLDPRYRDAQGLAGQDEWWIIMHRLWPASFDPMQHGNWGRQVNFHNVPGDAGPPGSGGVGWGFGAGSSALALDWLNKPSPQLSVLTAYRSEGGADYMLATPPRDQWQTYTLHFIAGRTDGTTPRAGLVELWENDRDEPLHRASNLNTVQRAQGPDGQWYVQRWFWLWEGDYTQNLQKPSSVSLALTQLGRTFDDALADTPVDHSRGDGPGVWGTATVLPPYDLANARFPKSLLSRQQQQCGHPHHAA